MTKNTEARATVGHRLSQDLKALVDSDGELTLGRFFEALQDRGFGLVLMLLSLPSALPVPAPGYSTPFGIMLAGLAVQMMVGRHRPWLPKRAARLKVSRPLAEKMIQAALSFFKKVERLVRPRWSWASGQTGHRLAGVVIFFMACLMILPIPGTNTAPAGIIFLLGMALTEEDGLLLGLATGLGVLTSILYGVLLAIIFYYGATGIKEAFQFLTT